MCDSKSWICSGIVPIECPIFSIRTMAIYICMSTSLTDFARPRLTSVSSRIVSRSGFSVLLCLDVLRCEDELRHCGEVRPRLFSHYGRISAIPRGCELLEAELYMLIAAKRVSNNNSTHHLTLKDTTCLNPPSFIVPNLQITTQQSLPSISPCP
jgi:hypothetical protein